MVELSLPPDDARTSWERLALERFLKSSPDIPPHIFKSFEVALWGACHVLKLMRDDTPDHSNYFNPPQGWFIFGTHVDAADPKKLEFWGDDGGGMPIWERPLEEPSDSPH